MGDTFPPQDVMITEGQSPPPIPTEEPKYGGFTRFEIELELVQSLASPEYLYWLAQQKYFENPAFVAYLKYLQYFTQPPYLKFLTYPGPTLKNLELLQQERFRTDLADFNIANMFREESFRASAAWPDMN